MTIPFTGGCRCGAVRVVGSSEPEITFFCHCTDCQRESGAPFSVELYLPRAAVSIEGELSEHSVIADSGQRVTRKFCPVCGCPIVVEFDRDEYRDYVCLKAGSLDDASWLKPQVHIFTSTKQPWVHISDDLPQYEGDLEV